MSCLCIALVTFCIKILWCHPPEKYDEALITNRLNDTIQSEKEPMQFTDEQITLFLDSIGSAKTDTWIHAVRSTSDSLFRNYKDFDITLSKEDFKILKQGSLRRLLSTAFFKKFFPDYTLENPREDGREIPIEYYSFGKKRNDFSQFALLPGRGRYGGMNSTNSLIYFFEGNKLIAKHNIYLYNHWDDDIRHFTDTDGKTVVYYKQILNRGTGVGLSTFNFYKYHNHGMIPILSELAEGYIGGWSSRNFGIESHIQRTRPLTIILRYAQSLVADDDILHPVNIIQGSTLVSYHWNERAKALQGQYFRSKISQAQLSSYFLSGKLEEEYLFINAHYNKLRKHLKNDSSNHAIKYYLNRVMNLR